MKESYDLFTSGSSNVQTVFESLSLNITKLASFICRARLTTLTKSVGQSQAPIIKNRGKWSEIKCAIV